MISTPHCQKICDNLRTANLSVARCGGVASATPTSAAVEPATEVQLKVKISLAGTSDKLDLSECGLTHIPESVWGLTNLQVCSFTNYG